MNYKGLIERLKCMAHIAYPESCRGNCTECASTLWEESATALETLLAERETLMGEIRGRCTFCANRIECAFNVNAKKDCVYGVSNWQWRGATPPDQEKEGNNDD